MCRRVKTHHAAVIRALHAEIKRAPGGFAALAEVTGRNAQVLRNGFDPNNMETAPSLEVFLEALQWAGAEATVRAVAGLAGMTAIPVSPVEDFCPRTAQAAFMRVVKELGDVQSVGAQALSDGHMDSAERAVTDREVAEAIAHLVAYQAYLRGA